MSENRRYYGKYIPQPWEPNREILEGMVIFGDNENRVREGLARARTHYEFGVNEAVWGPVRTVFEAFANAEIAGARLADTRPDSPVITAEHAAAYTDALARLDQARLESGMYGQAAEWSQIRKTIEDLEGIYNRPSCSQLNPSPSSQPKPSQPKPKPRPCGGFGGGGRRTRRRKGTMRHQRKKRSSRYKTYRKSAA
jgi:hypothetical protein